MRIALTGPSGTGKTTLTNFIQEEFPHLKFTSMSAGDLIPHEVQENLVVRYGWKRVGHQSVINLSNSNPEFGLVFQQELAKARLEFIKNNDDFIIDRCSLDNFVYFMLQCGHNQNYQTCEAFRQQALNTFNQLDAVIYLQFANDEGNVETNGSRVDNWHYQKMVDAVFTKYAAQFHKELPNVHFLLINSWNLEERKYLVRKFISELYLK